MTRVCGEKLFRSPWPPVMEMPGPLATIARAHQIAFVDRVAQIHREKRIRAHVAHRGKAGFQRLARIQDGGEGVVEGRVLEVVNFVVAVGARTKMGVAIDQAGKHRRLREVDHFGARRNL